MPLKWFVCPDGNQIEVGDCLSEGGCRMGHRCATRSYLQLVARERPLRWICDSCKQERKEPPRIYVPGSEPVCCGRKMRMRFSTTQLINGTMCAFLRLTTYYAVSPDDRAFMIHGTKGHNVLEGATDEYSLLEERFDAPLK